MGNRVDVSSDGAPARLNSFSQRGTASHKRVEYDEVAEPHRLIKKFSNIRLCRRNCPENDCAEGRPEPLGPPLVHVVRWPVYFFPPAFSLSDFAHKFEGKCV